MQTLIDFDRAPVFAIPTIEEVGGLAVREGMLIEGPQGWGEFSPLPDERALVRWLTAATEPGTVGWPDPVRGRVPIAVTIPAVDAARAREIAATSGCRTAAVEVGGGSLAEDIERVRAVRDGLGPGGALRCDAKGRWDPDTAITAIAALARAVDGLEYVAQPCPTIDDLARVRRRVEVPIAAGESIRSADDPMHLRLGEAADIAVLATGPLGGARRALRVAEACGLPCVVSSTLETTIGLAAGLALAGALPQLPFACELGTRAFLAGDVVADSRSLIAVDGYLPVAPMPPAPQRDLVERYAVTDPARVAWWRGRLQAAITAS
ncbi:MULTISPECIES: o-succinylbenzoate synthase [unclassified Mycolicibacterium]|uniref:o-succinylbenzoate synthase n=1 Tax=unclassified Mycolicibacterium TaxID=2636767 RepID=UPI001308EE52|nr:MULTISPECIES: o-succinylbenzoate synthase [unclassified Mycolicibacterium]MUL85569.1 O-succinylbenzoate synthase [Mycolicibacterium sp. CBMA 329]MUL88667.1 O-succinylbenzoate synthase [Mycolicibacterium sp. CBMA 331]MUM02038.1 O-succinylbenzoate synthase [Mycolicibacterium sp. CBMA 334]MUM26941.1 O-succinylbenzoate synthase [Mycolicibacterium sp. CBMA 295]MUM40314.1 O-succinylbenzoate synthase [Mycolicibacterium sp. CBMA 247]